jgi:Na+/melibiose symporter-like transporter
VHATVANFALFGLLFAVPQFFQSVNGESPLGSGVRLLPMIGGMLLGTQIGGGVAKRFGVRAVVAGGFVLAAAALGFAATTRVDTAYGFAAAWIAVLGLGIGLALPAAMSGALSALSAERAGAGSGLMQALRQVGGTIGVAILGTVLSSGYHDKLPDTGVPASLEQTVRDGVAAGVEVARRLHDDQLANAVRGAFVHGMDAALIVSCVLVAVAAVLAFLFLPRRPEAATLQPADQPAGGLSEVE